MKINDLISYLAAQDPSQRLPLGFGSPHPCHSVWCDVAFEPRYNITVADMLQSVRNAVETTFEVNHSGEKKVVKVRENTDCWLAKPGHSGVYISEPLIEAMVGYPAEAQMQPQPKKRGRSAGVQVDQKAA